MRVGIFSDTHLGYSAYNKVDSKGTNIRYHDTHQAFSDACKVFRDTECQVVLHVGDLFDTPNPDNRSICLAATELMQFDKTVITCGNHEISKKLWEVSPVDIMGAIMGISICEKDLVYSEKIKNLNVVSLGHCSSPEIFANELTKVYDNIVGDCINVLLLHGTVADSGIANPNECLIPPNWLKEAKKKFNHVFVGHWHEPSDIYVGSTVKTSFSQHLPRRVFVLDTDTDSLSNHIIYDRPMLTWEYTYNDGTITDIGNSFKECDTGRVPILKIKVCGIPITSRGLFFGEYIKRYKCFEKNFIAVVKEFDVVPDIQSGKVGTQNGVVIKSLTDEWGMFCENKEIMDLGLKYF